MMIKQIMHQLLDWKRKDDDKSVFQMDEREINLELKRQELVDKRSPWTTLVTIATIISLLAGAAVGFVGKAKIDSELEDKIKSMKIEKESIAGQIEEKEGVLVGLFWEESKFNAKMNYLDGVVTGKENILKEKNAEIDMLDNEIQRKTTHSSELGDEINNTRDDLELLNGKIDGAENSPRS